jgi:hypothetical protein
MNDNKPESPRVERLADRHIISEPPETIANLAPLDPKEEAKIRRDNRKHTVQLVNNVIATVVAALILLMAMAFTGWLVVSPDAPDYAKHLAFAVWGGLVGGAVGFLFGRKA